MDDPSPKPNQLDFKNTEIAFSNKNNSELKKMAWLFKLMNNRHLVKYGSILGLWAVKYRFPFADAVIKKTIFEQFCGGENLLDCQKAIDKLYKFDTLTILDYGAEGKESEDDFQNVMQENLRAIEMAASNNSVPVISVKLTGLVENDVLEKMQSKTSIDAVTLQKFEALKNRVDTICDKAFQHGVGVFIDAEESWIQDPIDELSIEMMAYYNKEKVIVYKTYQMYRKDKLADIKHDYENATKGQYLLGAKLVRGAYLEKETERAKEMGYPNPMQESKDDTDHDFDAGLQFCLDHYETISFCCASHNQKSNMVLAQWIEERNLDKSHSHLNFCQLYGMSDYVTFNLANAGFNVAKYVPYGPVKEVIPYLIRRAQENTSVTGEMSRELMFVEMEIARRGVK